MQRTTYAWISRTVAVAALGLLAAGTASGAAFRLHYDPQFTATGSLNNLGFRGDGELTVSDDCLDQQGLIEPGFGTCTSAFFTSLTVELYNFADSVSNPPPTPLETLTFVPHDPALDASITGLAVQIIVPNPGEIAAIKTVWIGPVDAFAITGGSGPDPLPAPDDGNPSDDSHVFLQFLAANFDVGPFHVDPQAFLKICDLDNDNCTTSNPAIVHFERIVPQQTVPEPASIALLLAALAAGWIQWRRVRA